VPSSRNIVESRKKLWRSLNSGPETGLLRLRRIRDTPKIRKVAGDLRAPTSQMVCGRSEIARYPGGLYAQAEALSYCSRVLLVLLPRLGVDLLGSGFRCGANRSVPVALWWR